MALQEETDRATHTKKILFLSNVCQEPFIALNLMLDVIISAHFGASAMQISILTTIRPVLAVFAFYWGSLLLFKPGLLRFSLWGATALATALFLFAPFADSIWYFIIAEACFVLFWRSAIPAQMEILKTNINKGVRERIFSQALSVSRISGILIGPILGLCLKLEPDLWKELFCITATLYILSALLKSRFYVPKSAAITQTVSVREMFMKPWKDAFRLLKTNRAFAQFQLGFFIAGSGLMFAKPSIPGFLTSLNLSFFEIFSLFTLLEGLGFILTSTLWARYLARVGLNATSCFVLLCFSLQPLLLIFATPLCVFLAYFFYGAAQAGSQLVWNLSGPLLCGKESSAPYSSVNILAIGIRGSFVPLLGGLFSQVFGPHMALGVSFLCMLGGAFYLLQVSRALQPEGVESH